MSRYVIWPAAARLLLRSATPVDCPIASSWRDSRRRHHPLVHHPATALEASALRAIAPSLSHRAGARIVLLALTPTPSFAVAVRCRQAQPFQNGDILHSNFYQPHVHVGSHLELALAANQSQLEPAHTAPNQSSHSSPSPLDPPPLIGEFDRIRADHEIVCAATRCLSSPRHPHSRTSTPPTTTLTAARGTPPSPCP